MLLRSFFPVVHPSFKACNVLLLQSVGVLLSYLFPTKPTRKDWSGNHPATGGLPVSQLEAQRTHPFPTEILPITWPKGWPWALFSYGFRSTHRVQPPGTEGYKVEIYPSPPPRAPGCQFVVANEGFFCFCEASQGLRNIIKASWVGGWVDPMDSG